MDPIALVLSDRNHLHKLSLLQTEYLGEVTCALIHEIKGMNKIFQKQISCFYNKSIIWILPLLQISICFSDLEDPSIFLLDNLY